jgi:hypothetical protein
MISKISKYDLEYEFEQRITKAIKQTKVLTEENKKLKKYVVDLSYAVEKLLKNNMDFPTTNYQPMSDDERIDLIHKMKDMRFECDPLNKDNE